ncbi:MAG: hypothetical protein OXC28_18170 [Defluviicoccus sp.]|nr:hypothetical protein [Defluviicoccus sp.]
MGEDVPLPVAEPAGPPERVDDFMGQILVRIVRINVQQGQMTHAPRRRGYFRVGASGLGETHAQASASSGGGGFAPGLSKTCSAGLFESKIGTELPVKAINSISLPPSGGETGVGDGGPLFGREAPGLPERVDDFMGQGLLRMRGIDAAEHELADLAVAAADQSG